MSLWLAERLVVEDCQSLKLGRPKDYHLELAGNIRPYQITDEPGGCSSDPERSHSTRPERVGRPFRVESPIQLTEVVFSNPKGLIQNDR
jgi:hypothetical protein